MSRSELNLDSWLQKARRATSNTNPKAPEYIAGKILKLNPTQITSQSNQIKLSRGQKLKLDNLLGKLLSGRPLPAVLHHTQFHNVCLKVNRRVLSPRAETEELVDYAIKNIPKKSKVFDIGTGTGAIGLSLAKARLDLNITLTDISNRTLDLAKRNARLNNITSVRFTKNPLIKNIAQKELQNAYFLANLPYVNPSWKGIKHKNLKYEPHSALFASKNGLQIIQNFLNQLVYKKLLTEDNWALLEHDPKQFIELQNICKKLSLTTEQVSSFITLVKLS